MRLSVPHNWQKDLIETVDLTLIKEFYGKLEADIFGGGRSSNICPEVSKRAAEREIKRIHAKGIKFNYLLNSNCLDNQELTNSFQRKMEKLLGWLRSISVDSVTVSLPYIIGFIKKNYPGLEVGVSTMAHVDSVDKAKFWEDLGASKITLYEVSVNRNFKLIEKIRKTVKCELQLIANNGCLYDCPFTMYHGFLCSHASQSGHFLGGFSLDFYRVFCGYLRLKDPVNFIRADWIRPEDLHYYEDLGIDYIKLVNRGMSSDIIKKIVKAYSERRYEGNLLDLIPSPSKNTNYRNPNPLFLFRYFFRPHLVNIFKLIKMKNFFNEDAVCIDNGQLEGFLFSLQEKNCDLTSCSACNWCREIAQKAVTINKEIADESLKRNKDLINEFTSGSLFKY